MLRRQAGSAEFIWKAGTTEAKGHHPAEFRFGCNPDLGDVFFNGVCGIRAKYYLDIDAGNAFTRYLLDELSEQLMASAEHAARIEDVRRSLSAESAKIWIDEDACNLDKDSIDAEKLISIEVPHWVKAARAASAALRAGRLPLPRVKDKALLGVQVPDCCGIGVFGGWLHDVSNSEFLAPSKRNRGRHVRAYGFS